MRKEKKLRLSLLITTAFVATVLFMPGLIHAGKFTIEFTYDVAQKKLEYVRVVQASKAGQDAPVKKPTDDDRKNMKSVNVIDKGELILYKNPSDPNDPCICFWGQCGCW
jgi:hypothetical protein